MSAVIADLSYLVVFLHQMCDRVLNQACLRTIPIPVAGVYIGALVKRQNLEGFGSPRLLIGYRDREEIDFRFDSIRPPFCSLMGTKTADRFVLPDAWASHLDAARA